MTKICVLDDWQDIARKSADWSAVTTRAEVTFRTEPFASEDEAAAVLADYDVLCVMRERTPFPPSLIARLPKLKMFNLTGKRAGSIDLAGMINKGITVCYAEGGENGVGTSELALALMLSAARNIPASERALREGRFQKGTAPGFELAGKTLGIIGLGRLGRQMAHYGLALGMKVLAWSTNLTPEAAEAAGATYRTKEQLIAESDAISLHVVLSDRSRGMIGAKELAAMKPGAILINTSRGPLVDEAALIDVLKAGRIVAALDVYNKEPLPKDHPLLGLGNTVLTPHIGYGTDETFASFYTQTVENLLAYLDGAPIRLLKI